MNENNPITSIDTNTIKNIYAGKINNWKSLKGINYKIMAFKNINKDIDKYVRESLTNDLARSYHEFYLSGEYVSTGAFYAIKHEKYSSTGVSYMNFQNAIGYSWKSIMDEKVIQENQSDIKYLEIDGVFPS